MTAGMSYDRVVPLDNTSGVPGMGKDSSMAKSVSIDATIQKHKDILRAKKENLRRLLQQSSNGSAKVSSSPDLRSKREEMKEQRSPSYEYRSSSSDSHLKQKLESAPPLPKLSDSLRSSSPTSVEGISDESPQSVRSSRSRMSSSESARAKKREARIKIFVLLLQPTSRIFELIQIVYNPVGTTIGDVLALIPDNATEQELGAQEHRGFCRPMDGVEMTDMTMLASGRRRTNCARIHRGEILVAIPRGHTGPDCMTLAQPILQNPKLVKLLSQTNPKKSSSRRGSRSRRSAPGSASRARRQRSSPSLPIETVIEEGDENDEEMEEMASDLYSVGSDRGQRRQASVTRVSSSSAIQVEQPRLPVHQEYDDDDDSTIASNDSSIASSVLAREIEELAESQGRNEFSPQVSRKTDQSSSTHLETSSIATPNRQAILPASTSSPASPAVTKTFYKDDHEIDCVQIGRVLLTQSKRAVRICIRRSLEYYAIKSKEWNKRRRRRHASFLHPNVILMCMLAMMFMVSVNKFTTDPQAETMTMTSKEASFGFFGLVKIFMILFILAEGQRNVHVLYTESTEKSRRSSLSTPRNSRRFKSMHKSPSAATFRPMMDVDNNSRSASLSPRRKGTMYMNDWREASNMY